MQEVASLTWRTYVMGRDEEYCGCCCCCCWPAASSSPRWEFRAEMSDRRCCWVVQQLFYVRVAASQNRCIYLYDHVVILPRRANPCRRLLCTRRAARPPGAAAGRPAADWHWWPHVLLKPPAWRTWVGRWRRYGGDSALTIPDRHVNNCDDEEQTKREANLMMITAAAGRQGGARDQGPHVRLCLTRLPYPPIAAAGRAGPGAWGRCEPKKIY